MIIPISLIDVADIVQTNNSLKRVIRFTSVSALPHRLASKVEDAGCWYWNGSTDPCGYGQVWWEGRPRKAHRVVYELAVGAIPHGAELDHLCRVRNCVNPEHLEPVTHRENLLRGDTFQRANASKTHCKRGHAFDDANTHILRTGSRKCRACDRIRANARNAELRARRAANHE